jgi:hypothetical protein
VLFGGAYPDVGVQSLRDICFRFFPRLLPLFKFNDDIKTNNKILRNLRPGIENLHGLSIVFIYNWALLLRRDRRDKFAEVNVPV